MRMISVKRFAALCMLAALIVSCKASNLPAGLYARLNTSKGDIVIKLEYEKAPLTVGNFVGLAEGRLDASKGKKYFDGLSFHRVVPGFVIQSGDPKADGTGGPGYEFPNEIAADLKYDAEGVVGMANAGPNTNGSQFFITLKATPQLDGGYSIFGKVVEGMDVVKQIAQGDKLVKVEIIRSGSAAKSFKADQSAWNSREGPLVEAIKKAASDTRAKDLETVKQKWPDLVPDADGIYQKTIKTGHGRLPDYGPDRVRLVQGHADRRQGLRPVRLPRRAGRLPGGRRPHHRRLGQGRHADEEGRETHGRHSARARLRIARHSRRPDRARQLPRLRDRARRA